MAHKSWGWQPKPVKLKQGDEIEPIKKNQV